MWSMVAFLSRVFLIVMDRSIITDYLYLTSLLDVVSLTLFMPSLTLPLWTGIVGLYVVANERGAVI